VFVGVKPSFIVTVPRVSTLKNPQPRFLGVSLDATSRRFFRTRKLL